MCHILTGVNMQGLEKGSTQPGRQESHCKGSMGDTARLDCQPRMWWILPGWDRGKYCQTGRRRNPAKLGLGGEKANLIPD
jgi:hypothetical protein